MPAGTNVRPQKWHNVIDLYDDGDYSAIWGNYDGDPKRCLGVRWNGNAGPGFPSQGGNPLWHVEPGFAQKEILLALLAKLMTGSSSPRVTQLSSNILVALSEL